MNVDTLNSKYKVVSKYFTSKTVMDESLTDFQEKKIFNVKNIKAPAVKPKVKKVKRVKGQKDIRTALRQKKNELIAYSKDFDTVCKTSGIDVDSEQLQLAIALSKSLETSETTENPGNCSKSLTTQQRAGLIRTTLKEYGFKVPDKPNTNRKTKKRRKPYKLLLTSDEEKQQIITDKYSQLLFELNNLSATSDEDLVIPNLFLYNLATNMEYKHIKDDGIFYVDSLIEEAANTVGSLLKNWSDIPGRPLSPAIDKSELLFSDIECSQEEMDIVLSGPLKYSKEILKNKNLKDRGRNFNRSTVEENINETTMESKECTTPLLLTKSGSVGGNTRPKSKNFLIIVTDIEEKNIPAETQPSRSLSPDLFDDEDDAVVEIANETTTKIINENASNVTKYASEVMDLTECVNVMCQNNNASKYVQPFPQLSQQVDVTKRKSNDYMEMTECVGGSSQYILERINGQIDLTADCENPYTSETACAENGVRELNDPQTELKKYDECLDLTSHCEGVIEIEKDSTCENVRKTGPTGDNLLDKIDQNIDLTGHCADIEKENKGADADHLEQMDLTQSSNSSSDTLPFVHISGKQIVQDNSQDDTIILNETEYLETKSSVVNKECENVDIKTPLSAVNKTENNSSNPLNQCSDTKTQTEGTIAITSPKNIFVEMDKTPIIILEQTYEMVGTVDGNIDLTQSSNSNEGPNDEVFYNISNCINTSSLGKNDDVSVDYDEALENMNSFPYYTHDKNDHNSIELNHTQKLNEKENPSNSRKSVLELSDNELISPTKSKNVDDHFDFGGISVIDNLPSFRRKSRNTLNSIPNGSLSDSLPMVNVKGRASPEKGPEFLDPILDININHQSESENEKLNSSRVQTPQTKINRHLNIETPEQSEYIVKTDNVTPMLDYASMSSPERNRELDKYGLKPFKRKRAIQLLTHLYNQTHPYVESTDEMPSPSKKRKIEDQSQPSPSKPSSRTSISPRNKSKSPRKAPTSPRKGANDYGNLNQSDKENELFLVTSEMPAIRKIECDADDWVFQKREKAKLHTCRVPLHIAFHNYVSCRRRLHEAILRYEPVNIDVIHRDLAASGHRYDPKDLLKFMDKKCITVKTADNTKNNKRY